MIKKVFKYGVKFDVKYTLAQKQKKSSSFKLKLNRSFLISIK